MSKTVDVVVVGAGLSGLQAALDIHGAGHSVVILEARDRVGGKTHSIQRPDGKGVQEIGAAWLNDTNQSHVWKYVKQFGLTPVVQNIKGSVASEDENGKCHFFPFGQLPKFEETAREEITKLRDLTEASSLDPTSFTQPKRDELDSITFEQWCRDMGVGTKALRTARVWCRGTSGQDPSDISALAYLEVCRGGLGLVNLRHDGKDGAQYLRLEQGTQSIAIGMSRLLPEAVIRLNTPVGRIVRQSSNSYVVTTTQGENFKARKVVISIPSPAYKSITFEPPLPRAKQIYTNAARYGCFVKFICLFETPFWRRQGSCGLAQSFRGPLNHCRDTSVDHLNNYALTCFLCAGPGRRWLALSEEDRVEAVLRQLGSLFGLGFENVKADFRGSITSEWNDDQWAGWGCPFAFPPAGTLGPCGVDNIVHQKFDGMYFVGTELTDAWRGYMEGALRSGQRGAAQVLADLNAAQSML